MKLRILDEAESELLAAMRFYEARQQGLGLDFYERISACMAAIAEAPLQFAIYEGARSRLGVRRALVERFPYVIVYKGVAAGGGRRCCCACQPTTRILGATVAAVAYVPPL